VYGAIRFAKAVQAAGIKPIFGSELSLANGHHLTLLVENEMGWRNLC
jgi:error-prone DNA polymerase